MGAAESPQNVSVDLNKIEKVETPKEEPALDELVETDEEPTVIWNRELRRKAAQWYARGGRDKIRCKRKRK